MRIISGKRDTPDPEDAAIVTTGCHPQRAKKKPARRTPILFLRHPLDKGLESAFSDTQAHDLVSRISLTGPIT
jgi:hypothetical protein